VRLVGFVHQRVGVEERRSLQHSFQDGHIIDAAALEPCAWDGQRKGRVVDDIFDFVVE